MTPSGGQAAYFTIASTSRMAVHFTYKFFNNWFSLSISLPANTDHQRQTLSGNREQNNRRLPDNEGRRGRSLLLPSAMHDAARLLAVEAYVRGSTDNVGVCVVDLLS